MHAQSPYDWTRRKKQHAVGLGLLISCVASMNGTILSVAHESINKDFSMHDGIIPTSYWPTASWGLGSALIPILLFPVMEDFGVRPVVLITYLIFICSLVPIGPAPSFETLVAVRFISGGCVQLLSNAVAGIISNVYEDDRARSLPIAMYVTTYLATTSLGPVIGATILEYLDWRWIGYIELIWTTAFFPALVIALPESRASVIVQATERTMERSKNSQSPGREQKSTKWYRKLAASVQRPLYMLCTQSVVFIAAMWAAFSLGLIYIFTQSVEQVYRELFGWSTIQAGYVQTAIVVGEILGCGLCIVSNRWYFASAARNLEFPGLPIPEARLYAAIIGGILGVTGGMLVYGWTSYPHIPWVVPTIGLAMAGFGTTAVVVSIANYLVDAYSKFAASALGAVGLAENLSIAFLPLVTTALYTNLGFHWASSLLAFISLVLTGTPAVVIYYGPAIRRRSPFMKEAMTDRLAGTTTTQEV